METTIKTTLHHYSFNTRNSEEAAAWGELQTKLLASGVHCMSAFGEGKHRLSTMPKTEEVEIETRHLFSDQYSTIDGRRVFDWRLITPYPGDNKFLKRGHWVEQTEQLKAAKAETLVCGYCGKKYGPHHPEHSPIEGAHIVEGRRFCSSCLGGEYLERDELHLLELRPVAEWMPKREKLSDSGNVVLTDLYTEAQNRGGDARTAGAITKAKQKAVADYEKALIDAERSKIDAATVRDGRLWLLERGLKLDPIFYTHTQKWGFGWSRPLCKTDTERLLEVVSEFPWPYEIKSELGHYSADR